MIHWHPLPAAVYTLVEQTPGTVLLESARPGPSSLSRLFIRPLRVLEASEFSELPDLFSNIETATNAGHFAVGFFAYECGEYFEPIAALRRRRPEDLLAWFAIYQNCYTFDHNLGAFLEKQLPDLPPAASPPDTSPSVPSPAMEEQQFTSRIEQIHEWIRAGDVYQLNFTFPIHARTTESAAELYSRLRAAQPVDYAAFLHWRPARHIVSLSPELFFRIDPSASGRRITTRPMKGTARRGRTTAEDRKIAAWLRNDPKNRAENVMIVDLLRNDLGRLCTFGSVRVEKLFEVERYPTLWQMTSTISGDLRSDVNYQQIFRALFPCGSVTGAPKVRAMQLLARIEETPRGIYTGAIGFFSRDKSVFSVAIRTLSLENGSAIMGVGSGIVIDSDPAAEFRECQLKAEFLTSSGESFSLIETMVWQGNYPLLELHLDRLSDSAEYFGFPCDREAIRATLLAAAGEFPDPRSRKVRLLLDADGTPHIECELLSDQPGEYSEPARVCIATQRTEPGDRFLFHKTTRRALYNAAFAAASAAGFADVLFLNTRDELTESAIGNVFIEKAGRWYTPPLDCGVLPGVYRRHLLATRPEIEERILFVDDLKAADGVYLSNAVRGLRRVTVDWNLSSGN
jgi:para-aminobenzoate synthetase/4-amino-4-deoxychorismate lyase